MRRVLEMRPVVARWVAVALLIGAVSPARVLAQVETSASMLGEVKDESGGVLPGVTVTVKNLDTGVTRTVVTDARGRYSAPQLSLGHNYEVRAELSGFQTVIRRGIELTLGREAVVDLVLTVGSMTENVVVTSEAALVETTNAQVSGHVTEQQLHDLPSNGRSYLDLTLLQPGTIQARSASGTSLGDVGTHITVSGARPTATTFLLDGTTTTSVRGAGPTSIVGTALGMDGIREFEVITSPYNAEYGHGTGGTISVVSKSGSNAMHGSGFEYFRNAKMDARNFFDPVDGPPPFERNQFGGSFGGPILRNKTFIFGNYEGLRQTLSSSQIYRVPTASTRQGVINGVSVPLSAAVVPYLNLYPLPNGRDFGDGTAEYHTTFKRPSKENYAMVRVDHQLSGSESLFVRYTTSKATDVESGNLNLFPANDLSQDHYFTVEQKSILSPRLLNSARFGYTHHLVQSVDAVGDQYKALAIQGTQVPSLAPGTLSAIGVGDTNPQAFRDNTFEGSDNVTYTRGKHSLKAGGQVQFSQNNSVSATRQSSRWNFGSVTDFLAGKASRLQIAPRELADPERNLRQTFWASYLQDNVRVNDRLTLNLGLRAEQAGTISELQGRLAHLPLEQFSTATFDNIQTGSPWYQNPGLTLGPRLGMAWDPTGSGKTAIRVGGGLFYDHIWSWYMSGAGAYRMGPFYNTFDLRQTVAFPQSIDQILALLQAQQGRAQPFGNAVYEPDQNPHKQRVAQYGVDLQRQLTETFVVKVGYKGSHGDHLARVVDANTAVPLSVTDGVPVFSAKPTAANPTFGTMTYLPTDSTSAYNALLVEANKRLSRGLHFQVSYTLSRLTDEGAGVRTSGDAIAGAGGGTATSLLFPAADLGLSTFNVTHNLVANFGYQLPFGAGRGKPLAGLANAVLGGWDLDSIITLSSGNPATFAVGTTSATALLQGGIRRPNLVAGGDDNPVLGGPDQYYDPSQFTMPDPTHWGTVGRNTLIGPGYATVNAALVKNFPLQGGSKIGVRAEAFNLLNRANFSLPDMQVFDGSGNRNPGAGRITSTSGSSRQIQLSLRVDW